MSGFFAGKTGNKKDVAESRMLGIMTLGMNNLGGRTVVQDECGLQCACFPTIDPLRDDGASISPQNTEMCIKAGADILVAGSSVFDGDIRGNLEKFQQVFEK